MSNGDCGDGEEEPRRSMRKQIDGAVVWLASMVLRLASKEYRLMLEGAIKYGLASARRDEAEGRDLPVGWLP